MHSHVVYAWNRFIHQVQIQLPEPDRIDAALVDLERIHDSEAR